MKLKNCFLVFLVGLMIPVSSATCPPGQSDVVVTVDPDISYCDETSWDIVNKHCSVVVASSGGELNQDGVNTWPFCLPDGEYTLTIYDSYGDGLGYDDDITSGIDDPVGFGVTVNDVVQFNVDGYDVGEWYYYSRDFTVSTGTTVRIHFVFMFLSCPIVNILIKYFH